MYHCHVLNLLLKLIGCEVQTLHDVACVLSGFRGAQYMHCHCIPHKCVIVRQKHTDVSINMQVLLGVLSGKAISNEVTHSTNNKDEQNSYNSKIYSS